MRFDEFMEALLEFLPSATVGEDSEGQIIIYTDLRELPTGEIVPFL